MASIRFLAALALLLPAAVLPQPQPQPQAQPRSYAAVVTHVTDGDTVWVRPVRGGRRVELRLAGIDAPEICQRFGEQSRHALAQQVLRRTVVVEEQGRDDFGRVIARVNRSGDDVGAWLVAHGLAWSPGFRRQPGPYAAQQLQAQQARRGLWASPHPLEPRAFRRLHGPCAPQDKR